MEGEVEEFEQSMGKEQEKDQSLRNSSPESRTHNSSDFGCNTIHRRVALPALINAKLGTKQINQ